MANCSRLIVCATNDFPNLRYSKDENGSPYPPAVEASLSYEARNCIPLFWLCLFEGKHLRRVLLPDEENPIAGYAVPALFASRRDATKNLLRRSPLLKQILPASVLALYEDFADKVKKDEGPFFLVIAEEIARMREEGKYADAITNALWVMETLPPEEWAKDFDFSTVTDLDQKLPLTNSEGHTFIGYDKTPRLEDKPDENIQEGHGAVEEGEEDSDDGNDTENINKSPKYADPAINPELHALHARAQQGDIEAQYELAEALLEDLGARQSEAFARQELSTVPEWENDLPARALEGDAEAQYTLGFALLVGKGFERDYFGGWKWFREAAAQGHAEAQRIVDKLGADADEINDAAVKWMRKAANQGLPQAQNMMGILYEEGEYLDPDWRQAVYWYSKAANQGVATAMYSLAGLLETGDEYEEAGDTEPDREQAVYWYSKAASQDYTPAMYALASLLVEIEDSEVNRAAARDLLLRAADLDPNESRQYQGLLGRLGVEIPTDELSDPEESQKGFAPLNRFQAQNPTDGRHEDPGPASLVQAVLEASANSTEPLKMVRHTLQHQLTPREIFKISMILLLAVAPPLIAGLLYSDWWFLVIPVLLFIAFDALNDVINNFSIDAENRTIHLDGSRLPFAAVAPSDFRVETDQGKTVVLYCPPEKKYAVLGVFTGSKAKVEANRLRDALLALVSYGARFG